MLGAAVSLIVTAVLSTIDASPQLYSQTIFSDEDINVTWREENLWGRQTVEVDPRGQYFEPQPVNPDPLEQNKMIFGTSMPSEIVNRIFPPLRLSSNKLRPLAKTLHHSMSASVLSCERNYFVSVGFPIPYLTWRSTYTGFVDPSFDHPAWSNQWSLVLFDPLKFVVSLLCFACTAMPFIICFRYLVRLIRYRFNRCVECGYTLNHLVSPGCPECGWGRRELNGKSVFK